MKIFITGGISSGKSDYAERCALSLYEASLAADSKNSLKDISGMKSGFLHFFATAKVGGLSLKSETYDEEFVLKIEKHKNKRSNLFTVHENYFDLLTEIKNICNNRIDNSKKNAQSTEIVVILIDSLTMWLSSIFQKMEDYDFASEKIYNLAEYINQIKCSVITVADSLGFTVVPIDAYLRKFIELNGIMEQKISASSDKSYLVVAGNPILIKKK